MSPCQRVWSFVLALPLVVVGIAGCATETTETEGEEGDSAIQAAVSMTCSFQGGEEVFEDAFSKPYELQLRDSGGTGRFVDDEPGQEDNWKYKRKEGAFRLYLDPSQTAEALPVGASLTGDEWSIVHGLLVSTPVAEGREGTVKLSMLIKRGNTVKLYKGSEEALAVDAALERAEGFMERSMLEGIRDLGNAEPVGTCRP
jgi:hypothetical protein